MRGLIFAAPSYVASRTGLFLLIPFLGVVLLGCTGGVKQSVTPSVAQATAPATSASPTATPQYPLNDGFADLEARLKESFQLSNEANWEIRYDSLLTQSQKRACSLARFVEYENEALMVRRLAGGSGELAIGNLRVEIDRHAGKATYTVLLDGSPLKTFTSANPDLWLLRDGAWWDISENPDDPCYNYEDSSRFTLAREMSSDAFVPPILLREWDVLKGQRGEESYPDDVATDVEVDAGGNVYVANPVTNEIQKFTSAGVFLARWGDQGYGTGQFRARFGIALDSQGNVYVADTGNNRIQKFTSEGVFLSMWPSKADLIIGVPSSDDGRFSQPSDVAVDSEGIVYVADRGNDRIQKFTSEGVFLSMWRGQGDGDGDLQGPSHLAVDAEGNVYVSEEYGPIRRIQKFTSDGVFLAKWGSTGSGVLEFDSPRDVTVDSEGNVYVADAGNDRIQKFTSEGILLANWEIGSNILAGITVDSEGKVYVVGAGESGEVRVYPPPPTP